MSNQMNNKKSKNQEIIGRIHVNQSSNFPGRNIQVNIKKRGESTNQSNIKLKNKENQQNKIQKKSNIVSNIITQVEKDKKIENELIESKKIENKYENQNKQKSHSHSPNRLLNSGMKINNGLLPPKISDKKTLVLDLDETLVHSGFIPFDYPSDVIIKIELDNEIHDIHVLVRPGVKEFLEKMAKKFELVIFTASLSKYADPLLDIIDKQGFCPFRLFREHCTLINTSFVKDLKRLGRDLKDIIIVDNSPISYALNPDNGLPILSWFDDKDDRELYHLTPILEFLADVPDVREYIKKIVVDNEIAYSKASYIINVYNLMIKNKIKEQDKTEKERKDKEKNKKENEDKDKKNINEKKDKGNEDKIEEKKEKEENKKVKEKEKKDKEDKDKKEKLMDKEKEKEDKGEKKVDKKKEKGKNENENENSQQINIKIINNNITNIVYENNKKTKEEDKKMNLSKEIHHQPSSSMPQVKYNLIKANKHRSQKSLNFNNNSNNMNNNLKIFRFKKENNVPQTTQHQKNVFLNTGYIHNVKTTRANNLNNNSKQINITGIDFMKVNKKKSQIKYSGFPSNNISNRDNSSQFQGKKDLTLGKNKSTNYLMSNDNSKVELKNLNNNSKIMLSGNNTTKNFNHGKSLSYNFDIGSYTQNRPKSSKKAIFFNGRDNSTKNKNVKDLKVELNEILQRKNDSQSSRANDLRGGFKYNLNNPLSSSTNFTVKYTNKIIKDKGSS